MKSAGTCRRQAAFARESELGFQEFKTAEFARQRLESLGIEDIAGIAVNGVTGKIVGTKPGKKGMFCSGRIWMPIPKNPMPVCSQTDGVMHACGQMPIPRSCLVWRGCWERKDQFAGTVTLCFQPAEEMPPGGAIQMIEEGNVLTVWMRCSTPYGSRPSTGEVAIAGDGDGWR